MFKVKYSPIKKKYTQRINFNKDKFVIYGKRTLKSPNEIKKMYKKKLLYKESNILEHQGCNENQCCHSGIHSVIECKNLILPY